MSENSARSASGIRQRILYLADFVIVPLAIAVLVNVAGLTRFPLIAVGFAVWTLAEYLLHRFALHWLPAGLRLHQPHHDHPSDIDLERSSLSTPLIACPIGLVLMVVAGINDGSALFTGLLLGYLAFIVMHHAVHRWTIEGNSWLGPVVTRLDDPECRELWLSLNFPFRSRIIIQDEIGRVQWKSPKFASMITIPTFGGYRQAPATTLLT